jgi:hypothetical protein
LGVLIHLSADDAIRQVEKGSGGRAGITAGIKNGGFGLRAAGGVT